MPDHARAGLAAAHALTGWALERGYELRGFSVSQPSLEDVYLRLTEPESPSRCRCDDPNDRARAPSARDVALTAWQVRYEQRAFWRNRTRAFFSFGMPVMLLLLFGALNSGGEIQERGNIPYVTFFLPGILAYGIIITQFVNMAGGIAIQRDNGLLKRMRGTPLPGWAYVAGRLGSTALVSVAHDRRHAGPRHGSPSTCTCAPRPLPALVVTVLLGAATFAALGMARRMLIPNAEAARSSPTCSSCRCPSSRASGTR